MTATTHSASIADDFRAFLRWLGSLTVNAVPQGAKPDPLVAIIQAYNTAYGPSPRTGGVIHAIDLAEATRIAGLMRAVAAPAKLDLAAFAAYISGESRFDELAFSPNNQHAKPGDDAHAVFLRSDIGIAQMNGPGIEAYCELGTPWQEQQRRAFQAAWALPIMAKRISADIAWGQQQHRAFLALGVKPSYGSDSRILAAQSYNKGRTGAKNLALDPHGDFGYGIALVKRWDEFAKTIS